MADIQRYLNLITSQHAKAPNFIAWLTACLNKGDDITSIASNFNLYFDIDQAIGSQLDILGLIITGKSDTRKLSFQPTDGSSPLMNDDTFRLVLKAKIALNQWDGTIETIYDLWLNIFPDYALIIRDNQDMSMNVVVYGMSTQMQIDLVNNGYIVPKPQGVSVAYSFSTTPLFGYDVYSNIIKGYDEGSWLQNT